METHGKPAQDPATVPASEFPRCAQRIKKAQVVYKHWWDVTGKGRHSTAEAHGKQQAWRAFQHKEKTKI